ncbi:GNAT family N-acetyltransferase [Agromyces tropicus]|uniref:GNAT family N-acetyltransferase n=1 Tax=Agromyces tropicus TaxID=555371 RepID=A0ABN2U1J4_9MICO
MAIDIRPIRVPEAGAGAARPDALDELERLARFESDVDLDIWGHDHFAMSATELATNYRPSDYRGRAIIGAWEGDDLIGAARMAWELRDGARAAETVLAVAPGRRRRGVGTALLAEAERMAQEAGRPTIVAWSDHARDELAVGDDVLRPPDGDAELRADLPTSRFAAARGYELQQLERVSGLTVTGRADGFRGMLAERRDAAASAGYRLVAWTGPAPDDLVDAYAAARARMALDVPAGGSTIDEETWDAGRVRAHEAEHADGATGLLVAAAVAEDGTVAGYTELELPAGKRIAYQSDTLVVLAHRGHGLGMLLKLHNLVRLAEAAPERTDVYTWNADENAHMLAINVALGFEPRGLSACWQRPHDRGGTS